MLQITIPATEQWDEVKEEYVYGDEQTLCLEHSLVSLSKWESKWHKAFLTNKDKTQEETLDYIRCMTLNEVADPNVYTRLTNSNLQEIYDYINEPMTATILAEDKNAKTNREVTTAELIYYWMISLQVPVEFETWHLNRLITLIRVCGVKNAPPKKMSMRDRVSHNASLNAARRKRLGTRG